MERSCLDFINLHPGVFLLSSPILVITTYFVIDQLIGKLFCSYLSHMRSMELLLSHFKTLMQISSLFFSIGSENNTSNFGISREFGNENLVKRIVKWLLDFYSYLNSIYNTVKGLNPVISKVG